jgi:hypothetical protein
MTVSRRKTRPASPRGKPSLAPLGVELGTRAVDDPIEPGARLQAVVNLKESPLDHWRASGHVDAAQYAAGDRFRRLWESARQSGARAFDFTRPRVDGRAQAGADPMRTASALRGLAEIETLLGRRSFRLVSAMIGERKFPADLFAEETERKYAARRVRDALGELAEAWGMVARGRG